MKFNFRKISAVAGSILMTTMTAGLAAAATYPAPFIDNGSANVAIVYGTGAGVSALDAVEGGNIQADLATYLTGVGSSIVGGDSVQIHKTQDKFNLGDNATAFQPSFDADELSTILAEGVYENDANDEFEYDQEIELGPLTLSHFEDSEFNEDDPMIGFALADGDFILNYTLSFSPDDAEGLDADWTGIKFTDLTMLGRNYYVSDMSNDTGTVVLELLDRANSVIVVKDESADVVVGGETFTILVTWMDGDEVVLNINGVETNKLNEGDTERIGGTDSYVAILNNFYDAKESGISKVEISIGTGKLELTHGDEVELNGDELSDLEGSESIVTAFFTTTGTDLSEIVLEWTLDDDQWITPGTDLVMPGFEVIKLSMGDFVAAADEETTIEPDGDDTVRISTTLTDGDVTFSVLYTNATGTGFTGLGDDANDRLVTSNTSELIIDEDTDEWFPVTWIDGDDSESYMLKVTSIDDGSTGNDNTTIIESQAAGSTQSISLDIGDTDDLGQIDFTLNAANENTGVVNITISAAGSSGNVFADRIVTAGGLQIMLPLDDASAVAPGNALNLSADPTTYTFLFNESDEDDTVAAGTTFTVGTAITSNSATTVNTVSPDEHETGDDTDKFVSYVVSDLATMLLRDSSADEDSVTITYNSGEAYGEVFLSEAETMISTGGDAQLGNVLVKDTEVSSVSGKNLVVVGGSCINSAAAALLGGAHCGSAFTDATGVGSGQFLIQGYASSSLTSELALLVAGYEAADTTNGGTYLRTQTVDTSSKYTGTSATSATLVV